jgi:hypothetical protein
MIGTTNLQNPNKIMNEKIVELKNVIAEAAAIVKQLQIEKPHCDSPFIGGMRSKATALEEAIGCHQVWLDALPSAPIATKPSA